MKTFARIGAISSFTLFFLPAVLAFRAPKEGQDSLFATMLGCCLLGLGVFLGTILWLAGDKCGSNQNRK